MRRTLIACLLFLAEPFSVWAMELPSLRGELSGQLHLTTLEGSPPIMWRTEMNSSEGTGSHLVVTAESSGLILQLELEFTDDGGMGRWRIVEGELNIAEWWRLLTSYFDVQELPVDMELSGILKLSGKGSLDRNEFTGLLVASMQHAAVSSVERDWEVSRFDLKARVNLDASKPLLSSVMLTAPCATVSGVELKDLILAASGAAQNRLVVNRAQVDLWEGRVRLNEFEFDLENPEIHATVLLEEVSLEELARFVPSALSAAQGRLSGSSDLKWSSAAGLEIGTGALNVTSDTPASLRLAPSPDFLTQHLPEKIMTLPALFGPIARWLALDNPAYEILRQIELGEMPLVVEKLSISLYPDGPHGRKSAVVEVVARPAESRVVDRVSFKINVSGPLKEVLLLSSDDRARLEIK